MTLYRIRFELCSSIVTPLKGDTIWGHIVWGIANHEGDEAVTKFLEQEKSDPPALVVSSAFPAGMLCLSLPPVKEDESIDDEDKYTEEKRKKKKTKYMPAEDYFKDTKTPVKTIENPFKSVPVMHNTIDRSMNTVLESGLYSTEEKWHDANIEWDFYILSSFKPERVKELVDWAFENGYGADASTGKGKINIKGNPIPVETKIRGNKYMALGPFVGTEKIKNIRADIFVRSGKLGGSFASFMTPHKKPVVLFDEGAVFNCDTEIKYAGILLEKMHGTDKYNICQSGFAPVIPIG